MRKILELLKNEIGMSVIIVLTLAVVGICIAGMAMPLEPVEPARVPNKKDYGTRVTVIWEGELVPQETTEVAVFTAMPQDF